jgi:putative membrane protein
MLRWIIRLLLNGGALLLISWMFENVKVADYATAVLAALILGIVNTLVRPILTALTIPITFLTLGLFWFVVNAATFWLTAQLIDGFDVEGILTTIFAAALMSVFGSIIHSFTKKRD